MTYISKYVQDDSSYTPYIEAVFTTLSGAGWELHDEISTTKKVFKSKGEQGNYCYGYMLASLEATYYLELRMYHDWNLSAHTGIAGTYFSISDARTLISLYKPVLLYCSKDFLLIWSSQASPNDTYVSFAGMLSGVHDTVLTTTVSGVSAGSSVSIQVESSSGFIKGANYKVVGVANEGREVVTVGYIPDNTHLVVNTLGATYASGTYIGKEPCPIFSLYAVTSAGILSGCTYNATYSDNGTGDQTSVYCRYDSTNIISKGYLDPNPSYNLYGLCPYMFVGYPGYSPVGYIENMYALPVTPGGNTQYDGIYMNGELYIVKAQSLITVSSATTNTVTFSSVSWNVNELQNKILVMTLGNSAGHTRKIASNTADTITVNIDFDIIPVLSDVSLVCDEVYRPVNSIGVKEEI